MKKKISIIFGLLIAIMCLTACSSFKNEDTEVVGETDRIELANVDKDKETENEEFITEESNIELSVEEKATEHKTIIDQISNQPDLEFGQFIIVVDDSRRVISKFSVTEKSMNCNEIGDLPITNHEKVVEKHTMFSIMDPGIDTRKLETDTIYEIVNPCSYLRLLYKSYDISGYEVFMTTYKSNEEYTAYEDVLKNSLGDEENNNFYNSVMRKVDDEYIMIHTMIPLELEEEVPTEVLEIVDELCESLVEYISRVEVSYDEPVIRIAQE